MGHEPRSVDCQILCISGPQTGPTTNVTNDGRDRGNTLQKCTETHTDSFKPMPTLRAQVRKWNSKRAKNLPKVTSQTNVENRL